MTTWNSGYVAEIEYIYGYFRELSPGLLSLAMLNRATRGNGARVPRYLELGFGQGLSLAIHAAACEGEFWGTDFHPGQAAHARSLVEAAGVDARIFDQSFAEFAARDDLPEFDFITLHGIWSWVAPEQRATIVDLVRRRLAVGGILFLSYNAMPGCAPLVPLRDLLALHAKFASPPGGSVPMRVADAMTFTRSVIESGANYFFANPIVATRFEGIEGHDTNYLAHEYLNEHWHPMGFAEVSAQLDEAKVSFVGSTRMADHIDAMHVHPNGLAVLDRISNPVLRESVRDVMVNSQFRADVFVRGHRSITDRERLAGYLATRFVLTTPPADIPMTLKTVAGELVFDETIYGPLLAALADSAYAPKTLATIRTWPGLEDKALEGLIQAILVLNGEGHVHPAQPGATIERVRDRCHQLNAALIKQACFRDRIYYLASPVTGAGFRVAWIEQLFLLAQSAGKPIAAWPVFVYATVTAAGGTLRNEERVMTNAEEGEAEIERQAEVFVARRLPILQALDIA